MKKLFFFVAVIAAIVASAFDAHAQVKIGTNPNTIHKGSILELESDTMGVLFPRVQLTNLTAWGPLKGDTVAGMMVYNKNAAIGQGFYYWQSAKWVRITNINTDSNIYNSDGTLSANRIVSMNGQNLLFTGTGNVGFGTALPATKVHIAATANPLRLDGLQNSTSTTDKLVVAGTDGVLKTINRQDIGGSTGSVQSKFANLRLNDTLNFDILSVKIFSFSGGYRPYLSWKLLQDLPSGASIEMPIAYNMDIVQKYGAPSATIYVQKSMRAHAPMPDYYNSFNQSNMEWLDDNHFYQRGEFVLRDGNNLTRYVVTGYYNNTTNAIDVLIEIHTLN